MEDGFVKLWRKTKDSRVFRNEGLFKVWMWCLMKASHKKRWWTMKTGKSEIEVEILPGQFVFGRLSAAKELNMKPSTVRNRMTKLKNMLNLDIKEDSQYSIISITNWGTYQPIDSKEDSKEDNQRTIKGQSKDTDKNVKKEETERINKSFVQKKDFAPQEPEFYLTYKKRKISGKRLETFEMFWNAFGDKRSKATATDSWLDIPALTDSLVFDIVEAAKIYSSNREKLKADGTTPKMAQGWLSARRWEDEQEHQETDAEYAKRRGLN